MTNKEVILKAIAYIEKNLKEDIDVFKVSQEVCYSLYHFIRLFQSISGFSPKNYIQQRRLTETVYELNNTDKKISDIAFEFQFNNHETFTRAFRKAFNINPSDIRNGFSFTSLPLLKPITPDYIYLSDKIRNIPPELVELPEKILVGISFFVEDNENIIDLSKEWARFSKELHTIKNRTIPGRFFQVQFWSANQEIGGMFFFTGTEVLKAEDINPLYIIKIIPAGKYLKFVHKGFANKVGYAYKYIYSEFLPETDYKLNRPFNFEFYGEKHKGPCDENSETEIYIPVE